MQETVKQRLVRYMKYKNISQKRFEEASGLSNGYINSLKNSPTVTKLQNIIGAYPDINKIWLLTGEGEMLNSGQSIVGDSNTATQNNGNNNATNNTTNNYSDCSDETLKDKPKISYTKGRPYYDVDFIGGFDLVLNDQTTTPQYNIDFHPYNKEGVLWCNITGHSMEPKISNGDIIAIREVQDWMSFINYGEIYAIVTTNEMRTVKIVRKGMDENHYRLIPINTEEYDEQQIKKTQIMRIFSVLGCVKKM